MKNFRSILDESLPCDSLTALVGRNGSGKSSFLSALELFYNPSARIAADDYYAGDTTQDIEIAVAFAGLTTEAKELFSPYINNGVLMVVRVFAEWTGTSTGNYHGVRLQNPHFVSVRNAGANMDVRRKYAEIRQTDQYSSLPAVRSADADLKEWNSAKATTRGSVNHYVTMDNSLDSDR